MYFYTGPGGATNDSPINSDDDEETVKVRREEPILQNTTMTRFLDKH